MNNSEANVVRISTTTFPQFWCSILSTYPFHWYQRFKTLLPFPSTYQCETDFSRQLAMKKIGID